MKRKLLIILIAILVSSFTYELCVSTFPKNENEKILLIEYKEYSTCRVLKEYKKIKNKESDSCFEFIDILADNSMYDKTNRVLSFYGNFKPADSTRILFWEYGNNRDVNLPYKHSNITWNRFINDSVVRFTLNNKEHILVPGQFFNDSSITIVKSKNELLQYTTEYFIRNHGLIYRKDVLDYRHVIEREYEQARIRDSVDMYDLNQLEEKK